MISNKTVVILFLITLLSVKTVASTSPDDPPKANLLGSLFSLVRRCVYRRRTRKTMTSFPDTDNIVSPVETHEDTRFLGHTQISNPPGKPTFQIRKRRLSSKSKKSVLKDTTNEVGVVQQTGESIGEMVHVQEQSAPQLNKRLEELIDQGKYKEIVELGKGMNQEEFLEHLSQVVKTPEQSKDLAKHLGSYAWTVPFYIYGDFGIVKKAVIANSGANDFEKPAENGILVTALRLAIERDRHDRAAELLNFREEIASGKTEWPHGSVSFGKFLTLFFEGFITETDGMTLKRFLTLHGDKFRNEYPDIFDAFYRKLVGRLRLELDEPNCKKLLIDMIGQPSLLTPTLFARGFLETVRNWDRHELVEYAWREAIEEGLKKECPGGGEELWKAMTENYKDRFSGDYPSTSDALTTVLEKFLTKQQKEDEWTNAVAPGFLDTIKLIFADIFHTDLTSLVIGYARPTWIDVSIIKSL